MRHPRSAISRSPVKRTPPRPARMPFAPIPRSSASRASSAPRGQVAYQERNTHQRSAGTSAKLLRGRDAVLRGHSRQRRSASFITGKSRHSDPRSWITSSGSSWCKPCSASASPFGSCNPCFIRPGAVRSEYLACAWSSSPSASRCGRERKPRASRTTERNSAGCSPRGEPAELRQCPRPVDRVGIAAFHRIEQADHLAALLRLDRVLDAFDASSRTNCARGRYPATGRRDGARRAGRRAIPSRRHPLFAAAHAVKRYGSSVAVGPIDLAVPANATTSLIGPSGAGKSTLLRMLNGLIWPDEGVVRFRGEPLPRDGLPALRRQIGYVVQGGGLVRISTRARTSHWWRGFWGGTRSASIAGIEELAAMVRLPADSLGKFPRQLSGGQAQRVGLMRALMLDPARAAARRAARRARPHDPLRPAAGPARRLRAAGQDGGAGHARPGGGGVPFGARGAAARRAGRAGGPVAEASARSRRRVRRPISSRARRRLS